MDELIKKYKEEIVPISEDIDPDSKELWSSLTLGWALAKGATIQEALEFSSFIRYKTNLPG